MEVSREVLDNSRELWKSSGHFCGPRESFVEVFREVLQKSLGKLWGLQGSSVEVFKEVMGNSVEVYRETLSL